MPDNPQPAATVWFALSDHRILALHGRDAVAFAQSQFMNDVAALAEGGWQWNGWLTPKGRVIALFALIRIDADTLWLLLPDADPGTLAERLRRFVFRSKVTLTVRDDLLAEGKSSASLLASGSHWAGAVETAVELDISGEGGERALRIAPAQAEPTIANTDALLQWKRLDLEHGWPRLDETQREQWTPQQLSLERLKAYSVKKGCYPGQEIVARTHFLGQAKRGLGLIRSVDTLVPGAELQRDGQNAGAIVSSAGGTALAVMPLESAPAENDVGATLKNENPASGGVSWSASPLKGGMLR
jgi:tRNA-modifying protein YgfZ